MTLKKSILLLGLMGVSQLLNAQNVNKQTLLSGAGINIIPKVFTSNNCPQLHFLQDDKIAVYDTDIKLQKEVAIEDAIAEYPSSITSTREVTDVKRSLNDNEEYKSFLPSTTTGVMIDEIININSAWAGPTPLSYRQDENGNYIFFSTNKSEYQSPDTRFYGYDLFETKYPLRFFILKDHTLYKAFAIYEASYSDWKETKRTTETIENGPIRLEYKNFDTDGSSDDGIYFYTSQSLFNSNNDYEYILPILDIEAKNNTSTNTPNIWEVITSQTISYDPTIKAKGVKIVSENGANAKEILFEDGFYLPSGDCIEDADVVRMGEKTYLSFTGKLKEDEDADANSYYTLFYQIKDANGSIEKVDSPIQMRVSPTRLKRNETININFGTSGNADREISIYSMQGNKAIKSTVSAEDVKGEVKAELAPGMYIVNAKEGDTVIGTSKIVIN